MICQVPFAAGSWGRSGPRGRLLPKGPDLEKITGRETPRRRAINQRRSVIVAERSKYQQNIIKNYYENREAISLQRLSELVTELYLAEGKARQKQWKNIAVALEKLKVPAKRIEHLVQSDNAALVAKLVEELLAKK
jgi:hypothetical protein